METKTESKGLKEPEIVASFLNISLKELRRLTNLGVLKSTRTKDGVRYDWLQTTRSYIIHIQNERDNPQKTSEEIAERLGITQRRVQQLSVDGVFKPIKTKNGKVYDYDACVLAYINTFRNSKEINQNFERRKFEADVEFKEAKARRATLELKELQGKMHRSEDVEEMTVQLLGFIRSQLLAFAGTLAVDLENIEGIARRSGVIKKSVNRVLLDMMEFQYSPDRYKDLVQERGGWIAKDDDYEEDED